MNESSPGIFFAHVCKKVKNKALVIIQNEYKLT